jgi:hypothetical protein
MPGFDRTGPLGAGPLTGGGFGSCNRSTGSAVGGRKNDPIRGRGAGRGRRAGHGAATGRCRPAGGGWGRARQPLDSEES